MFGVTNNLPFLIVSVIYSVVKCQLKAVEKEVLHLRSVMDTVH